MITRFIAIMFVVASLAVGPVLAQNNDNAVERKAKEVGREVQESTKDVVGKVDGVPSNLKDYAERSQEASTVIQEVMGIPEDGIPEELMSRATAVAVIPHMVKAAFGIGGSYGKGLVSQRLPSGRWSPPAFIEIGGGSFGLQLGGSATDLILVFTSRDGLDGLLKGKLKLGADAAVAAGPVGRKAQIGTDVLLKSPIVSYSRSKGLFAGISLDGSVVAIDDSANTKVYANNVDARTILDGKVTMNAVVRPFVDALEKNSPAAKKAAER